MSTILRTEALDRSREYRMSRRIDRRVAESGARRGMTEVVVAFPVLRWPDRPWCETTATIRADIIQEAFNAGDAEGAFVTANACLERVGWQLQVAVFAGRSELEHQPVTSLISPAVRVVLRRVLVRFVVPATPPGPEPAMQRALLRWLCSLYECHVPRVRAGPSRKTTADRI